MSVSQSPCLNTRLGPKVQNAPNRQGLEIPGLVSWSDGEGSEYLFELGLSLRHDCSGCFSDYELGKF